MNRSFVHNENEADDYIGEFKKKLSFNEDTELGAAMPFQVLFLDRIIFIGGSGW